MRYASYGLAESFDPANATKRDRTMHSHLIPHVPTANDSAASKGIAMACLLGLAIYAAVFAVFYYWP